MFQHGVDLSFRVPKLDRAARGEAEFRGFVAERVQLSSEVSTFAGKARAISWLFTTFAFRTAKHGLKM
jgi:hypothetical protein